MSVLNVVIIVLVFILDVLVNNYVISFIMLEQLTNSLYILIFNKIILIYKENIVIYKDLLINIKTV